MNEYKERLKHKLNVHPAGQYKIETLAEYLGICMESASVYLDEWDIKWIIKGNGVFYLLGA